MPDDKERRPRALVVNDTQEILELFQDILGGIGFECVLMSYAPRELDRVRETKPDIIVLDFLMGDRELLGWQLLQKLKMDRTLDSIPVVVCTGAVKTVQEQQGYLTEQGVLVVLKPFNVDQLEEAVLHAIRQGVTAREIVQDGRPARREARTAREAAPSARPKA
jgi:CheY-like chemotaxis protein